MVLSKEGLSGPGQSLLWPWQAETNFPPAVAFHSLLENDSKTSKCSDLTPQLSEILAQDLSTSALLAFGAEELSVVGTVLAIGRH